MGQICSRCLCFYTVFIFDSLEFFLFLFIDSGFMLHFGQLQLFLKEPDK